MNNGIDKKARTLGGAIRKVGCDWSAKLHCRKRCGGLFCPPSSSHPLRCGPASRALLLLLSAPCPFLYSWQMFRVIWDSYRVEPGLQARRPALLRIVANVVASAHPYLDESPRACLLLSAYDMITTSYGISQYVLATGEYIRTGAIARGWYGPCHDAKAESHPKEGWPDDINAILGTLAVTTSIIQVSIGSESATLL